MREPNSGPSWIDAYESRDNGHSWKYLNRPVSDTGEGGGRDIGYPRSIQCGDGNIVSVYYFWDPTTGPERYIAATIWDPAKAK